MYQHILVPVDASPCSATASAHAINLSKLIGSRITLAHVLEDTSDPDSARAQAQVLLERLAVGARIPPNLRITEARGRSIPEAIIALALEERAELIIMGTHGREGLELLKLGSVAQEVGSRTHLPLMIIPQKLPGHSPFGERLLRASRVTEEPDSSLERNLPTDE